MLVKKNNKLVKWPPLNHRSKDLNKSSLHLEARQIITKIFPLDIVLEEVPIPVKPVLFLDFYLPKRKLAIEINGEQHYKFNIFHFKSKFNWYKSIQNDKNKLDWCMENNIKLIVLKFNEKEKWEQQICHKREM